MPTNRLIREKSPYLLQHAHNPVDWRPWGREAFEEARGSNRPVFLSIGYSTCHWCHVMERESFEDAEVAALLNERYVPVKVDREERPDVDQVYMRACQALTGRGGWPLTLLLDGEGRPFYAATYLPKLSRGGQPGLIDLLGRIAEFWRERPGEVARAAAGIVEALGTEVRDEGAAGGVPGPSVYAAAVEQLAARFDERFGGFGPAPKFPAPHQLSFLLARCRRTGDARALAMACATLDAMRAGGLWDHLGGGFHRYSTDARWLVPHFEKMLYDQAGLAVAYAEAFQITGRSRYAATARATLGYVLRDLSDPGGGFHCGEDADSEGEEGRFYLWTTGEVERILGEPTGAAFAARYGMTGEGNYRDEATGEATGRNILHLPWHPGGGIDWEAEDRWAPARATLLAHRSRRVRPALDDKVLAGWTGFTASAFARVGAALGEPALAERARRALDFVDGTLGSGGRLLRRYRDGEAAVAAFAEDYAFLARGRLDLYGAAFDRSDLGRAVTLAEELWERFASEDGAIHETAHDAEPLVWRPREATDGALPAPGSVAVEVFSRLHLLTGEGKWADRAEKTARADGALVSSHPTAFCRLLQGAALLTEPTRVVTVTGPGNDPEAQRFLDAARGVYAPETAVLAAEEGGVAEARVCEGTACLPPVRSVEELKEVLSRAP